MHLLQLTRLNMITSPSTASHPASSRTPTKWEYRLPSIEQTNNLAQKDYANGPDVTMLVDENMLTRQSNPQPTPCVAIMPDSCCTQSGVTCRSNRPSRLNSPREGDEGHECPVRPESSSLSGKQWWLCVGLVIALLAFISLWVYHREIGAAIREL